MCKFLGISDWGVMPPKYRRQLRRWRLSRARRAAARDERQQWPSRRPKIDGKNVLGDTEAAGLCG